MHTTIAALALTLSLLTVPFISSADTLSDLQAQVAALTAQLKALTSAQQGNSGQGNSGQGNSGNSNGNPGKAPALCVDLKHTLSLDDDDAATDGEITKLQKFLADHGSSIYPEARITGYFGPATMRAVQRWQAKSGVVSSGDPDTTGYGYVGTKTRLAMACASAPTTGTSSSTPPVTTPPTTPTATTTPPVQTTQLPPPTSVTQPAILSLTADPSVITSVKSSSLISWKTQNFKSCSLIYSIYQQYGLGYSGVKVLTTVYTANGSFSVSPVSLVEGTDNPAYMATFVTLVCRDTFGGEKRAVVRFGPPSGYSDWQSVPNPWANAQPATDGTPIVSPPVNQTPTTTTPTVTTSTTTQTTNPSTSDTSSGTASVATASFDSNPTLTYSPTFTVTGSAANAGAVTLAIDTLGPVTRVYTSPSTPVQNGRWAIVVPTSLSHGLYRMSLISSYGTVIANASLTVDLNPHAWFTTPSGTEYTTANPSFSGTSTNMTTLEYGYVASNAPGGLEDVQTVGTVPVTNNTWTFTLNRTLTNGQWVAMTFNPSTHQPISSIGFTMNLPNPVVLGTYVGYRNGSMFITTENISQDDALANCQLNASNNPSAKIRCFWNTTQIYDNSGVICATASQTSCQSGYTAVGGGWDTNNCQQNISCVAISNWSTVTVSSNKSTYAAGESATLNWSIATTAPSTVQSIFSIVPVGMTIPNTFWPEGIDHGYISTNGAVSGSGTIVAPQSAGNYELLFRYGISPYVEGARGPQITVTERVVTPSTCPAGVTCPQFWTRPGDEAALCQRFTSQSQYTVVGTRTDPCNSTSCVVSPSYYWMFNTTAIFSSSYSKLPYDKTLFKVRCNAACTDAGGCANAVASSGSTNTSNLASALTALQSALAALRALMGR